MRGLLKAGLLAAPALSAAFVVPPQDERLQEWAEDNEDVEAVPSSWSLVMGVPTVETPGLDIDINAKTTAHVLPAAVFEVDVHPSEEACGFGAVTINKQDLPQQERDGKTSGKGSISTPDDHVVVASWNFECLKEEDVPVAQRLSFDVELVDGSAVSEQVGFQLEFSQHGSSPAIRKLKAWDQGEVDVVSHRKPLFFDMDEEEHEHKHDHSMSKEHEHHDHHDHPFHGMDEEDEHHEHPFPGMNEDGEHDRHHEDHHPHHFSQGLEHGEQPPFDHPSFDHPPFDPEHELHEIQCLKDQIHHLKHILHKKEKALAHQSGTSCHGFKKDVTDCDSMKCVLTALFAKAKGAVGHVTGGRFGMSGDGPEPPFGKPPFGKPPFGKPGKPHGPPGDHDEHRPHFNGSHPHGNETHGDHPHRHSFCEMFGGPHGFGSFRQGHEGHDGHKNHKWGHGPGFDAENFRGPHDKHHHKHHWEEDEFNHEFDFEHRKHHDDFETKEGDGFHPHKHHKGGKDKHDGKDKEAIGHHHKGGKHEHDGEETGRQHHQGDHSGKPHDEMKAKQDKPHHHDENKKHHDGPHDDVRVHDQKPHGDHPHGGPKGEHHPHGDHPHPHDGPDGDFHPHGDRPHPHDGPDGDSAPHGDRPRPFDGPHDKFHPHGPDDDIIGVIRFVKFIVCAVLFSAFAFALHRRISDPLRRASRRASHQQLYGRSEKKHALCSFFGRFYSGNNDFPGSFEEKRTLISSQTPQEDVMSSEIRQLQNAAGVVGDIVAAEEGRSAPTSLPQGLPVYHDEVPEVTLVDELPAYNMHDASDEASVVTDGFRYTPGSSEYTPSGSDSDSVNNILGDTKN